MHGHDFAKRTTATTTATTMQHRRRRSSSMSNNSSSNNNNDKQQQQQQQQQQRYVATTAATSSTTTITKTTTTNNKNDNSNNSNNGNNTGNNDDNNNGDKPGAAFRPVIRTALICARLGFLSAPAATASSQQTQEGISKNAQAACKTCCSCCCSYCCCRCRYCFLLACKSLQKLQLQTRMGRSHHCDCCRWPSINNVAAVACFAFSRSGSGTWTKR